MEMIGQSTRHEAWGLRIWYSPLPLWCLAFVLFKLNLFPSHFFLFNTFSCQLFSFFCSLSLVPFVVHFFCFCLYIAAFWYCSFLSLLMTFPTNPVSLSLKTNLHTHKPWELYILVQTLTCFIFLLQGSLPISSHERSQVPFSIHVFSLHSFIFPSCSSRHFGHTTSWF